MTTTTYTDSFARWATEVLIGICFRITPKGELAGWVVTSADRYSEDGTTELYTDAELRAFAIEQLNEYEITVHDVNSMKS